MKEPSNFDIMDAIQLMRYENDMRWAFSQGKANAVVKDNPKKPSEKMTRVNIQLENPFEGMRFADVLCTKKDIDIMGLGIGDKISIVGQIVIEEYNGKDYLKIWLSAINVVEKGDGAKEEQQAPRRQRYQRQQVEAAEPVEEINDEDIDF